MNPITNIKNQNALNERELRLGTAGNVDKSWHRDYKDSAWIYIGGLEYGLTEGDVICVFSQLAFCCFFFVFKMIQILKNGLRKITGKFFNYESASKFLASSCK